MSKFSRLTWAGLRSLSNHISKSEITLLNFNLSNPCIGRKLLIQNSWIPERFSSRCKTGSASSEEYDEEVELDDFSPQSTRADITHARLIGHSVLIIQPNVTWGPHKPQHTTIELMLQESAALIETLPGWRVLERFPINVKFDINHHQVFGSGNLDRLTLKIRTNPAVSAVFINVDVLSPKQQSCLYEEWKVPVYDRYQIVLLIFKLYANSKLARLHVAMAELPYVAARLRELTIGSIPDTLDVLNYVGGHGFKLLEERGDMFKKRETVLKKSIERVRQLRAQKHEKLKQRFPIIAVVGYTNSGKTSLVNCLTKSLRKKEDASLKPNDRLFATLDATMHFGKLSNSGLKVCLADTVGFIADIPATLVTTFEATLDCIRHASLVLHIRDVSHPDAHHQKDTVEQTLQKLELPSNLRNHVLEVCNKVDKVSNVSELPPENSRLFNISCVTGQGIERLQNEIDTLVRLLDNFVTVTLKVPNGGEAFRFLNDNFAISKFDETSGGSHLLITTTMHDYELKSFLKTYGNLLYLSKRP